MPNTSKNHQNLHKQKTLDYSSLPQLIISIQIHGKRMSWSGDWMCGACQHVNFKKRETCQKCTFPKYGGPTDVSAYLQNRTEVLAGDWYCQGAMNCGSHNYASRTSCYRCGSLKPGYSVGYDYSAYGSNPMATGGYGADAVIPGWKSGDWVCSRPGCGVHNYASRTECFRCKTPRDYGGAV